jgi:hypothetical protein
METFFKRVGIGAIVIITSPLWVAYFCLYVIFGSLMILLAPIRFIESIFTDKKLKIKNHFDDEAAAILSQKGDGYSVNQNSNVPQNTTANSQQTNYPPYNGNNYPTQQPPYYPPQGGYPQNTNTNYNQNNANYNGNNYPNYPDQNNNGRGGNQ